MRYLKIPFRIKSVNLVLAGLSFFLLGLAASRAPLPQLVKMAWAQVAQVVGGGTVNNLALFTTASGANPSNSVGNSQIYDNGTNVGIGTTGPGATLHVVGGDTTVFRIEKTGAGASSYRFDVGPAVNGDNSDLGIVPNTNSTGIVLYGRDSAGALQTGLAIQRTGNVGIGTTNPRQQLDVSGAIVAGNGHFVTGSSNGHLVIDTGAGGDIFFRSSGSANGDGEFTPFTDLAHISNAGILSAYGDVCAGGVCLSTLGGGPQNLQQVTDVGAVTNKAITTPNLYVGPGGTLSGSGNLHLQAENDLYLNPFGGGTTYIGFAGGGGNLTMGGNLDLPGGSISAAGNVCGFGGTKCLSQITPTTAALQCRTLLNQVGNNNSSPNCAGDELLTGGGANGPGNTNSAYPAGNHFNCVNSGESYVACYAICCKVVNN